MHLRSGKTISVSRNPEPRKPLPVPAPALPSSPLLPPSNLQPPQPQQQPDEDHAPTIEIADRTTPPPAPVPLNNNLPYCTQDCLRSLVGANSCKLDPECPNFSLHRRSSTIPFSSMVRITDPSTIPRAEVGIDPDTTQLTDLNHTKWTALTALYPTAPTHPLSPGELIWLVTSSPNRHTTTTFTPLNVCKGSTPRKLNATDKNTIYRVSLLTHGYTLIAKVSDADAAGEEGAGGRLLRHETRVYKRLYELQGGRIPVYIGKKYFWAKPRSALQRSHGKEGEGVDNGGGGGGCSMINPGRREDEWGCGGRKSLMLFLSYAGRGITRGERLHRSNGWGPGGHVEKFKRRIRDCGIDVEMHTRNMLYDERRKRVMFVDFERAEKRKSSKRRKIG